MTNVFVSHSIATSQNSNSQAAFLDGCIFCLALGTFQDAAGRLDVL